MIAADAQLARAEHLLAEVPEAAARAVARALNRAAVEGRRRAISAITAIYAIRPSDVAAKITLTEAKPDRLVVVVGSRSSSLSLGYFPHTPTLGGTGGRGRPPLRAEIRRGEEKSVAGAFVANLNSGPRIMRRTGGTTASGKSAIESIYSVPLAVMLGVPAVREDVEERALAVLDECLEREIGRELDRAAAAAGAA